MNSYQLVGLALRDPEILKKISKDNHTVGLMLACRDDITSEYEVIKCFADGSLAEQMLRVIFRGDLVLVSGSVRGRTRETAKNQGKYKTVGYTQTENCCYVRNFQKLSPRKDTGFKIEEFLEMFLPENIKKREKDRKGKLEVLRREIEQKYLADEELRQITEDDIITSVLNDEERKGDLDA